MLGFRAFLRLRRRSTVAARPASRRPSMPQRAGSSVMVWASAVAARRRAANPARAAAKHDAFRMVAMPRHGLPQRKKDTPRRCVPFWLDPVPSGRCDDARPRCAAAVNTATLIARACGGAARFCQEAMSARRRVIPEKPLVIVTRRKLPDIVETRDARAVRQSASNPDDKPMTQAQLVEALKDGRGSGPHCHRPARQPGDRQTGPNKPDRQFRGGRRDRIDVETARQRHRCHQTRRASPEDTADMTMALILAVPPHGGRRRGADERRFQGLIRRPGMQARIWGKAVWHRRHGPHRPGGRPPRQTFGLGSHHKPQAQNSQAIEQELGDARNRSARPRCSPVDIVD